MASDAEEDDYTDELLQRDVNELFATEDDGSGIDANIIAGRSAVFQEAQRISARNAAIHEDVVKFAGTLLETRKLWVIWIDELLQKRATDPLQFARNPDWNEDLDPFIGPRDTGRALTNGFEREGGNILWEYLSGVAFTTGQQQVWKSDLSFEDLLQLIKDAGDLGTRQKIRPLRRPKTNTELGTSKRTGRNVGFLAPLQENGGGQEFRGGAYQIERDVFGNPVEDPDNPGVAKQAPVDPALQRLKYARARSGTGSRILRDRAGKPILRARVRATKAATRAIRLQIQSVRLNEQHWEWMYSRHLKNDQMFDTPSMTPYLHNEEFAKPIPNKPKPKRRIGMNETGAAIPLLTRGTLGFAGVTLTKGNAGEAKPKLAVASRDDLTRNWTVARIRALPRMRFFNDKLPAKLVGVRVVDVTLLQDQALVKCLNVDSDDEVCWTTGFALSDVEIYTNAFYGDADATTRDGLQLGVRGYDSWGDGEPQNYAGALLASDAPAFADARLAQSFRGLPLYFASGNNVAKACKGQKETAITGQIEDVRVRDVGMQGPGDSKSNKSYSEVYRKLMWEPQPLLNVATFPSKGAAFRTKSDRQAPSNTEAAAQLPRYLNFTTNESNRANRTIKEDAPVVAPVVAPGAHGRTMHPPPTLNESVDIRLLQQYPEVVLFIPGDMRTRMPQANLLLNKETDQSKDFAAAWSQGNQKFLDAGRRGDAQFREFITKMNHDAKGRGLPGTVGDDARRAWRDALDSDAFAHLAPTTIRGAMARYMAENADALAYHCKDEQGALRPLETSHDKGLQQPGGVYYSCRIDTGVDTRQGGLDTFLPIPMEAGVFEIADLALARGVHDYVYTRPQGAPEAANPGFTTRAGPPQWWHDEQTTMRLRFRYKDAAPYQDAVAGKSASSIWAKNFVAGQPVPNPEVGRAIYDHLPPLPVEGARRSLFPTDQLRRLDTAEANPEPNNAPSLHAELAKALKSNYPGALPSHLTPTKLVLGSAVTENNLQSVVFDASYPPRLPGGSAAAVAKTIVQSLPHRHDLRVPCLPLYPTRLSLPARRAVWDRVHRLQEAERNRESPEVGKALPEDQAAFYAYATDELRNKALTPSTDAPEALPSTRIQGYEETRREGGWSQTLVAPLYVVALDYDDFKQAVVACDKEWTDFFKDYPVYWEHKDRFLKVERSSGVRYLALNTDYVYPARNDPAGHWETHDGTWPGMEDDESVKLATRPQKRTRESWFADRLRFGGRQTTTRAGGTASELERFKSKVCDWECMYRDYEQVRNKLHDASVLNGEIENRVNALRTDSLRLCWGLAKLGHQTPSDAGELYRADGEIPQIPKEELEKQGMRLFSYLQPNQDISELPEFERAKQAELTVQTLCDNNPDDPNKCTFHTNQLKELHTRLPLVILLVNTLDQLRKVREYTRWLEQTHRVLTGDANTRLENERILQMSGDRPLPFLKDLCAMPVSEWPTDARVNAMTRRAGVTVFALLTKLGQNEAVWDQIRTRAVALHKNDTDFDDRYKVIDPQLLRLQADGNTLVDSMMLVLGENDPDRHPLSHAMHPALYLFLDAWAEYIYEGRLEVIQKAMSEWVNPRYVGSDEAGEVGGLTFADVKTAVHYVSLEFIQKPLGERGGRDISSTSMLFGLSSVTDGKFELFQYARELIIVKQLLDQQKSFLYDNQVLLFGKDDLLGRAWDAEVKDIRLVQTTADAFSRIFFATASAPRHALSTHLGDLLAGGLNDADREAWGSEIRAMRERLTNLQETYREVKVVLPGREDEPEPEETVSDTLVRAFRVVEALTEERQGAQVDRINQMNADRKRAYKMVAVKRRLKAMSIASIRMQSATGALTVTETRLKADRDKLNNTPEDDKTRNELSAILNQVQENLVGMRARSKTLNLMGEVMQRCTAKGEDAVLKLYDKLNVMRSRAQQDARIARVQADGAPTPVDNDAEMADVDDEVVEDLFGVPLVPVVETDPVAEFQIGAQLQRARERAELEAREHNIFESLEVAGAEMLIVGELQRDASPVFDGYQEGGLERALRELAEEGDVFADIVNEVLAVEAENPTIPLLIEAQPPSLPFSPPEPFIGRSPVFLIPKTLELSPAVLGDTKDLKEDPLEDADQALDWLTEKLRAKTRTPEESKAWMLEIAEQRGKEAAVQWNGVIAQLEAQLAIVQSYHANMEQAVRDEAGKQKEQQHAVAHVRAYLLHPEWWLLNEDPEAQATEAREQLAHLNAELRLVPYTDNGMSTNEYRERLRGIGIDDPEACNDGNVDEINARELHGWKGQYRRHVATMIRVRSTGGPPAGSGMCYYLDALPPTPRQWLESTDAQRAPGPPRIPDRNPEAEADAALLQATSLAQGVRAIVGPEERWAGGYFGYAEELARTQKTLKALLIADRVFLTDPQRSLYAPFAFDFDAVEASSVINA
tara:strand:- start:7581 stop:14816 length:7236 start_codon:yes stop_codon:yes gene_type:complete